MKQTFLETDQLLSEHMPYVTRRLFWGVGIGFFMTQLMSLTFLSAAFWDRIAFLKAGQTIMQGHLWQLLIYPFAEPSERLLDSIIYTAFTLLLLFFFGRLVEEPMGSRRFAWFMGSVTVLTGVVYAALTLGMGAGFVPLAGFMPLNIALMVVAVMWYPNAIVRFMFFIPMPMKFLGGVIGVMLLLNAMSYISWAGWPVGYAMALPSAIAPLVAFALVRYPRFLNRLEDIWWHNPFRRGPKPVRNGRRGGGGRVGMGHPGRHSDVDDRYNDPHWRLDQ